MNDHDARVLTAWLDANEVRGSRAALDRALTAARGQRQRPGWLVSLRGGTIATDDSRRRLLALTLVTTVALVAALVAGAIVGGPIVRPDPSTAQPTQTRAPSPTQPTTFKERGGLVAFTHIEDLEQGVECPSWNSSLCHVPRLWVSNPDGSNAHELRPRIEGRQTALGWSPDGKWLLFDADDTPTLTDPTGSEVRPLIAARSLNLGGGQIAFSPDSTRLAFFRDVTANPEDGIELAILDIASGHVVSFESTRSHEGLGRPQWSPDGAWIAYERQGLIIIRPDGTGLRALTSDALPGSDPQWSADGMALAFTSSVLVGDEVQRHVVSDIYILPVDAGDPVRLTSDGISAVPSWTLDGRIVFIRLTQGEAEVIELWIMNADGSAPERLDANNVAALSEIGCIVCNGAFWQPTP
jgi:Tol biopolymer transport system component